MNLDKVLEIKQQLVDFCKERGLMLHVHEEREPELKRIRYSIIAPVDEKDNKNAR